MDQSLITRTPKARETNSFYYIFIFIFILRGVKYKIITIIIIYKKRKKKEFFGGGGGGGEGRRSRRVTWHVNYSCVH